MAMKQREAVYSSTTEVLAHKGIEFMPAVTDVRDVVTTEIRKEVADRVVNLFKSGQVEFKGTDANQAKLSDEKLLRNYVTGLITNWFNKDPQLNGGSKYQAKNPGSRAGSGDPQLKEMRILKKHLETTGNTDGVARVEQAIQARISEIQAEKSPALPEVSTDNLPDFLKDLAV
jgi:hypothetical protein